MTSFAQFVPATTPEPAQAQRTQESPCTPPPHLYFLFHRFFADHFVSWRVAAVPVTIANEEEGVPSRKQSDQQLTI